MDLIRCVSKRTEEEENGKGSRDGRGIGKRMVLASWE